MVRLFFARVASAARRLWRGAPPPPPAPSAVKASPACTATADDIAAALKESMGSSGYNKPSLSSRAPPLAVLVALGLAYAEKREALKVQKATNLSLEEDNKFLRVKAAAAEEQAQSGQQSNTKPWWFSIFHWY